MQEKSEKSEKTGENEEPDTQTTRIITDEVLRYRIRKLIDDPKPVPWWKRVLTSQLFSQVLSLILGFTLTVLVGTYLAYYYTRKQAELEHQRALYLRELEHERSIADELNKIRLSKIAEVWERVYVYEAAVEELMQGVEVKSDTPRQGEIQIRPGGKDLKTALEQSKGLYRQLSDVLIKNRLWLEDDNYYKIQEYGRFIYEYYFAKQTKQDIEKWEERRAKAKATLNEIRDKMLKGYFMTREP
jgi:hypothetical protein